MLRNRVIGYQAHRKRMTMREQRLQFLIGSGAGRIGQLHVALSSYDSCGHMRVWRWIDHRLTRSIDAFFALSRGKFARCHKLILGCALVDIGPSGSQGSRKDPRNRGRIDLNATEATSAPEGVLALLVDEMSGRARLSV